MSDEKIDPKIAVRAVLGAASALRNFDEVRLQQQAAVDAAQQELFFALNRDGKTLVVSDTASIAFKFGPRDERLQLRFRLVDVESALDEKAKPLFARSMKEDFTLDDMKSIESGAGWISERCIAMMTQRVLRSSEPAHGEALQQALLKQLGVVVYRFPLLRKVEALCAEAFAQGLRQYSFERNFKIGKSSSWALLDFYFPTVGLDLECNELNHVDREPGYHRRREFDLLKERSNMVFAYFNPNDRVNGVTRALLVEEVGRLLACLEGKPVSCCPRSLQFCNLSCCS
jgi:hypothetical protein